MISASVLVYVFEICAIFLRVFGIRFFPNCVQSFVIEVCVGFVCVVNVGGVVRVWILWCVVGEDM